MLTLVSGSAQDSFPELMPNSLFIYINKNKYINIFLLLDLLESSWRSLFSNEKPVVLCLGLGSPSSSRIARAQLAFLTETCQLLKVVCGFQSSCHKDPLLFLFCSDKNFFLSGFDILMNDE